MDYIKYIIFGLVQGVTEPIPVSSSGHLRILRSLINVDIFNDLNFEIFVNFGSFIAILIIFWDDVVKLINSFFNYIFKKEKKHKLNFEYCMKIIIGTIPAGIIGLLFKDFIEAKLANIKIVGFAFIITALALIIVRNIKGEKKDDDITYFDALIIGIMQAIAVFPGISRSGFTLVGCLLRNFKKDTALKYSFMLYFPVSVATFLLGFKDILVENTFASVIGPYLIGMIVAGLATYATTHWLFKMVKENKLVYFAVYCFFLAGLVLLYL